MINIDRLFMKKNIRGLSLFSSAGIGEYFLSRVGIDIIVANELIKKRADLYQKIYPNHKMVIGDIRDQRIFNKVLNIALTNQVDFLIASPPCQGMSVAGKNRDVSNMANDNRNYLIMYVIAMIKKLKPAYILIENVPFLLKLELYIDNKLTPIKNILEDEFGSEYHIHFDILDAADYGTPQRRKRAIIRLNKKGTIWNLPLKQNIVSVEQAIGNLPSIESGKHSGLKWHYGRGHTEQQIEWMKHTPTGKSAFENLVHYPRKANGEKVKGYHSSYRRIRWDEPAPTITIRNDAISSQRNVHPGRPLLDGTYSDARVLSVLELMRLTGLPDNWEIPDDTPEILIRQIIGECIPPLLIENITREIFNEN